MNLRHESDILPRCLQHVVQRAPTEALNFGRLCVLAGFMAPQENKSVAGSLSSRPFVRNSVGNGLIPKLFPLKGVLRLPVMYRTARKRYYRWFTANPKSTTMCILSGLRSTSKAKKKTRNTYGRQFIPTSSKKSPEVGGGHQLIYSQPYHLLIASFTTWESWGIRYQYRKKITISERRCLEGVPV